MAVEKPITVEQKLANLRNVSETWAPEDVTFEEFLELYSEIGRILFSEIDKDKSDFIN